MICHQCNEDKLSKEFPFHPLTKNCDHPLLHCLDCSVAFVKSKNQCSQCETDVSEDNKTYKDYVKTLEFLFPSEEADCEQDDYSCSEMDIAEGEIKVTTLTGEHATIAYYPQRKILDIKKEVEKEFQTPPEKQRLLFHDKELKTKDENDKELTLNDFQIPPNSTLQLIVILCVVPDDLEKLVFDFCWGLPPRKLKDYLDVSVFVYRGKSYVGVIYWRRQSLSDCPGVEHSGPADMDYEKQEGHHRVDINMTLVPHDMKLVFTLSSWASSSISSYPYRRLRFYDVDYPDGELCNDDMGSALYRESIIMCYLSRSEGKWRVERLKIGADGCTKSFTPLREEIEKLISNRKIT